MSPDTTVPLVAGFALGALTVMAIAVGISMYAMASLILGETDPEAQQKSRSSQLKRNSQTYILK